MADDSDNALWFPNQPGAEAAAGLLRAEGVPAEVEMRQPMPGLAEDVEVRVPAGLMRRARWIPAASDVTERELTCLATGELGADDASGSR